jgi:hypothetical protein
MTKAAVVKKDGRCRLGILSNHIGGFFGDHYRGRICVPGDNPQQQLTLERER